MLPVFSTSSCVLFDLIVTSAPREISSVTCNVLFALHCSGSTCSNDEAFSNGDLKMLAHSEQPASPAVANNEFEAQAQAVPV